MNLDGAALEELTLRTDDVLLEIFRQVPVRGGARPEIRAAARGGDQPAARWCGREPDEHRREIVGTHAGHVLEHDDERRAAIVDDAIRGAAVDDPRPRLSVVA